MINYYKELNLDKNIGLDELKKELIKQENLWNQRIVYNSEKATAKLALINQAMEVFASDATRRTYDLELDESYQQSKEDPDKERKEALKNWKIQAEMYFENEQYDLAKVAIENALSFSRVINDDELYSIAAQIYLENNNIDIAMNYINKAIVSAPNISSYYLIKGFIYDIKASTREWRGRNETPYSCWAEERNMYILALSKAEQNNEKPDIARSYGALAHSFYFEEPQNKVKGLHYAKLAMKYGGDDNAQIIIDIINKEKERKAQLENEKEQQIKDETYKKALKLSKSREISELQNAIEIFQYISPYKDTDEQIEKIENRIHKIEKNQAVDHIAIIIGLLLILMFMTGLIIYSSKDEYHNVVIGIVLVIIVLITRLIVVINSILQRKNC